jgi:hypothetical protein
MHERIPPVDKDSAETRLLRAIYGVCADCDHLALEHYDGDDYGSTHHCKECDNAN